MSEIDEGSWGPANETAIPETYAQFGEEAGAIMWGLHKQIRRLEVERERLKAERDNLALALAMALAMVMAMAIATT